MKGAVSPLVLSACFLALLGAAAPVHGASATFVSQADGDDMNACTSPPTACETLTGAYNKTDAGGVIHVLPGEYPSLEITKSVEIVADGGQASITSSATGGANTLGRFFVNTGAADDVRIRGFTLRAGTSGFVGPIAGISFVGAGALYVENCTLVDSGNDAILFIPTGASELYVSNSVVSDDTGSNGGGILIKPTGSGSAKVVLDNVSVEDNSTGVTIDGRNTTGSNNVTIRDSVVAGNSGFAVYGVDSGSGTTSVMIEGSNIANNGGNAVLAAGANTTVRLANSTISGNLRGLFVTSSGKIISVGGNVVRGNTTNGAFTATEAQQ